MTKIVILNLIKLKIKLKEVKQFAITIIIKLQIIKIMTKIHIVIILKKKKKNKKREKMEKKIKKVIKLMKRKIIKMI